ncbi:MAG: phosphoadenosine phosphosulfate reductase domain-containing protein [Candidatus Helarchaeota archaeon]
MSFKISNILKKMINESIRIIKNIKNKDKTYVCFSGGKDSLVSLDLAIKAGIKNVVFCDTTIEYPETLRYINKVKDFYDIEINIVSAPRKFFDLVYKVGFPSRQMRWCCKVFKFAPLNKFAIDNNIKNYITGLRSSEHNRRMGYKIIDNNHMIKTKQINPILNWNEDDIWKYITKNNLPYNPLYDLGFKRIGCWPCPFKSKSEWNLTKKYFPNLFNFLKDKLNSIYQECVGIGIINLNDFIENYKWTGYFRPQNSELKGKIEVFTDYVIIHFKNQRDLLKIMKIIKILSNEYEIIGNSIIIYRKLKRQTVKIFVEKGLNCVGCGACLVYCRSLEIENNHLKVNENMCNSCLKCLSTKLMRGACIMRNFSHYRYEVETCRDFQPNLKLDFSNNKLNGKIGLIRTRMPIDKILKMFEKIGSVNKNEDSYNIDNEKFAAWIYNSKGFIEIKVYPKNTILKDNLNYIRNILYSSS